VGICVHLWRSSGKVADATKKPGEIFCVPSRDADRAAPCSSRRGVLIAGAMSWFVVSLHYLAPLRDIDAAMKAHVAFLERHRKAGVFIAWGRKVPRSGGIILACGDDRAAIEQLMQDDPFVARALATVEVTEFLPKPSRIVAGVQRLLDSSD
jgi:uncharacterized protein YciI